MDESIFVGREVELDYLHQVCNKVLAGQGQVCFLTGDAGSGKTALFQTFVQQVQAKDQNVLAAVGNCNAATGFGEPYLPFRDLLGMLTGDVHTPHGAGATSPENTRRLQSFLESSVEVLIELGPDLLELFVPLAALGIRLGMFTAKKTGLSKRLEELFRKERPAPVSLNPEQLIQQYTRSLQGLAAKNPLVLLVDDLQWTDTASAGLFFHLSRQLSGYPIFLIGAYRSEEIYFSRHDPRHPLEKVLSEIKRYQGDVWIDLNQTQKRRGLQFVNAYLNSLPNNFEKGFRKAFYQHTGGHALFTVELLRFLESHGHISQNEEGQWQECADLDWKAIPPRVEGVIEERINRLEPGLREVLSIASVVGEEFTAQVVAHLLKINERQILRSLSVELDRRHHLVSELGEIWVGSQILTRFEFTQPLFQHYLYQQTGTGERRLLHGEIADVLENLYAGQTEKVCYQLAHHYTAAGQIEKSATYLQLSGDQARLLYAYEDANQHYRAALDQLRAFKASPDGIARTLMKLGLTYHLTFDYPSARQAFNDAFALWQHVETSPAKLPLAAAPLRVDWPYPPLSLDPAQAADGDTIGVVEQLFCGLVALSPELDLIPDLAESWQVEDRGLFYRFHLRPNLKWSDGKPLIAADFEFSWKRALDPETNAPLAHLLYDIHQARAFHQGEQTDPAQVGVLAQDQHTLVVRLEQPVSYFLYLLAHPIFMPVPRHCIQAFGEDWAEPHNLVSCGPFKLQAGCRLENICLKRNSHYPGQYFGNVAAVHLVSGNDDTDRLAEYRASGLDIVQLQRGEGPDPRQLHPSDYRSLPYLATAYLGFRVDQPPFDDPRLRKAFAHAIDRESLASVHLQGYVFPASGGFIPPGLPGHSPEIGLSLDVLKARRLLAEYRQSHSEFGQSAPIEIWSESGKESSAHFLSEQLQANLELPVTCQIVEWDDLTARLEDDPPPLFLEIWTADYPDPDTFLRDCDPLRWTHWRSPRFDRLVAQARQQSDPESRLELYRRAENNIIEQAVLAPLAYWRTHLLVIPSIHFLPSSPVKWWFWKDTIIKTGD